MTPTAFAKRMDEIIAQADLSAVKQDGMTLITTVLGDGIPGYMPALEKFAVRLERGAEKRARTVGEPL